ncbi:hydantoinase B/oxoprolinase family protein [Neobacillus drentensis]|uniref:hydantoinase B/oxoprolinase family protein n=1 Tax=Neobacillus drentensis TaxID=220684 RepID=UPI002FFE3033
MPFSIIDCLTYGGRPEKDGMDAMDFSSWNTRNNPIEDLDMHTPMICEQYELREDTGGAGKTRGGLGIVRWNRFLTDGLMTMAVIKINHFTRKLFPIMIFIINNFKW